MAQNSTYRQISKELFSLALPMMMTQLIAIGSGFLSMMMLSTLGHDVLAASALITSSRVTILITFSSILFSLSVLIGHAYGERQFFRIGNFMRQGWMLGLIITVPVMITFWNIAAILNYFGQSPKLTSIVQQFFHTNVWNVLPFMLSVCNQQLCYGVRKQRIDLLGNILGVCVLLVSAYVLIFGKLGMPELGVSGLGYAFDLQGWTYFLFTSSVIFSNYFFKQFALLSCRVHQNWQDFLLMFEIGWPIAVQIGGEMLSFFVGAAMVGWLGVSSLAAFQIVTQYFLLIMVPLFGLSQATGVTVGQANGEKNFIKIRKIGYTAIVLALLITFIVAVIFLCFPTFLASFYLDVDSPVNRVTVHLVVLLFGVSAIQQIFDAVRNILTGSLRGLFDTRFPMYVGLSGIWLIGLPLGYLLAFVFQLGVVGIALGITAGMFVGMLVLFHRWQRLTECLSGSPGKATLNVNLH